MDLHLAWATQTGNSVDLLREFIDHCKIQKIGIASIQQINKNLKIKEGIWIFFVSTTGQGSPPYGMRAFWKQLMKKSYKLQGCIQFSIYSLGDSSYGQNFGMTARKLRQRLKMLGAEQFQEIGLGDDLDPQGYRQVYLNIWRNQVTSFLLQKASKTMIQFSPQLISTRNYEEEFQFRIESIQQLSSHKNRRTFWAQLQVISQNVTAKQGDVIEIYPQNRQQDVQFLLKCCKKQGQQIVKYHNKQMSIRQLFLNHLNVSYILNYYFFVNSSCSKLLQSTENLLYRQKILQFRDNYEQYHNFIKKYKRNIIQFIKDFELQLNFDYIVTNLNQIIGRKYSIAKIEGKKIYLLIKLVQNNITQTRLYKGLCSHDLFKGKGQIRKGKILEGEIIPKQIRQNNIIITLGTGIAPFIWILDQLQRGNHRVALFYTNSFSDQIFHHKLVQMKEGEKYNQIISCTRENGKKMIRLLESQAQTLYNWIAKSPDLKNTKIFYCGPKQIYEYLLTFFSKLLNTDEADLKKSKMILYQNW